MAKYKPYSYAQGHFIPVYFNKQIQQGTFEYTLNYLIDTELDLSIFDQRFRNDENGAPAYDPRILSVNRFLPSRRLLAENARNLTFSSQQRAMTARLEFIPLE